jgi:hypothetical protein
MVATTGEAAERTKGDNDNLMMDPLQMCVLQSSFVIGKGGVSVPFSMTEEETEKAWNPAPSSTLEC